ncbi:MAG: MoaD/ThiS family protein [Oscillospiraceae bacterium]|nr:MoaD/ThiS family protein [Oscillospiraceae bacterium]
MTITVETGSWAARWLDQRVILLTDMPADATAADAILAAGIPQDEAGVIVRNGTLIPKDHRLSHGDVIKIHPIIIGG